MPEEDAEVGAVVIGRDDEAAVHVGVAARLVAQQPPDAVDDVAAPRVLAALADGRAGDIGRAGRDDPERLAGGVVVGRLHVDHGTAQPIGAARRPDAPDAPGLRAAGGLR